MRGNRRGGGSAILEARVCAVRELTRRALRAAECCAGTVKLSADDVCASDAVWIHCSSGEIRSTPITVRQRDRLASGDAAGAAGRRSRA
ncbi:hypothetical protein HPB50_005212 [Hyalomma asiaticum]|uniref:Uncharacterized protein n=1 Tax=Hyalomma asiaticum TaxID=266040 RepID=A0ACB7SL69_HYAAI|nr:hypothetical protein HPB50_005212 [Hyalomma asiaticum]